MRVILVLFAHKSLYGKTHIIKIGSLSTASLFPTARQKKRPGERGGCGRRNCRGSGSYGRGPVVVVRLTVVGGWVAGVGSVMVVGGASVVVVL